FGGLVGKELQPGRRLGSEFSDYAKRCGVGGIFHTDELPAYGITTDEVQRLKESLNAGTDDCVVLVAADAERARCAVRQVIRRAEMALEGIPEETRKMLEGGKGTAYLRPLPGAARMYPETDVVPVRIDRSRWEGIVIPELLSDRAARFSRDLGLDPALARQIAYAELLPVFEQAVATGIKPTLAARTITATWRELRREGVPLDRITDDLLLAVLRAVEEGRIAKEAVPDVLRAVAGGTLLDDILRASSASSVTTADLETMVDRILHERETFVRTRGMAALGPLMGVVMEEVRGRVDGKVVSEALRKALDRFLKSGS
ncbi:MAG: Glu-tRNA(Gln) amidotransferase subunit GatE, partial [Methanomicrobiales archaeon]|nr:Glu-tRNA(Gln) amidotransferase subunit GatE [Methanomicrobiales archaeon]